MERPISENKDLQYRLLKTLSREARLSQRALSRKAGWSVGNVNLCLNYLIKKDMVKRILDDERPGRANLRERQTEANFLRWEDGLTKFSTKKVEIDENLEVGNGMSEGARSWMKFGKQNPCLV